MKIEFGHIDVSFENFEGSDERLKRISDLIWKLLDEKLERDGGSSNNISSYHNNSSSSADTINKYNDSTLDKIVVPPVRVDSGRNDYDIASRCASAIYQAVLIKLR
jgi:hypothetical protein